MFIPRKKWNAIKAEVERLNKELAQAADAAILIGIERSGPVNKFTFVRGEKQYVVQTYGTISDNIPEWKEELLR